jgi:hypothetical protein
MMEASVEFELPSTSSAHSSASSGSLFGSAGAGVSVRVRL